MAFSSKYVSYIPSLAIGSVGVFIFYHLHLPMPWLLGALFSVFVAASVFGVPVVKPRKLSNPVRVVLGVSVGSAFSPALLNEVTTYLLSLLVLIPVIVLFIVMGFFYYRKVVGFDDKTAYFSALPGGMLEMIVICEAYGGDVRRVMLVHTMRVLLIVYSVPFAIHHFGGIDLSGQVNFSQELIATPVDQALILLAAGLFGWLVMDRSGLAGGAIIGPMAASAAVYGMGWVDTRVPNELINAAQLILGAGVGASFIGTTRKDFFHALFAAVGFFILLMTGVTLVATAVHQFTDIAFVATVLAFSPGGQAEMNVIALMVGIAVPYIAIHHLVRMFIVMSLAPLLASKFAGER